VAAPGRALGEATFTIFKDLVRTLRKDVFSQTE
jgi:hypothetical protein